MPSSAFHRLESLLRAKHLDDTLTHTWISARLGVVSSGVPALDTALGGGWPRGEVSELIGARSTGRTAAMLTSLAAATAQGEMAALVDAADRLDPAAASEAGIALDRLLWVRGPALTVEHAKPAALDRLVRQAVRAFDLIVRAGGFAMAVLDLADVPASALRGLPPATWLRIAHANEGQPTACLLIGESPMGRSARGRSLELRANPVWTGTSAQSQRFQGWATSRVLLPRS